MIDKNGKVFGKINIVDLIVLVVIIAAVAMFAVSKFNNSKDVVVDNEKTIYMSFYAEEISDFVADKIEIGAKVFDEDNKHVLGEVVKVETQPSVIYSVNSEGNSVLTTKENYNSVIVTAKVDGTLSDYGLVLNDFKYGVGHSMTLRAGYAKMYMRVYDIYTE